MSTAISGVFPNVFTGQPRLSLWNISLILLLVWLVRLAQCAYKGAMHRSNFRDFARKNNCAPGTALPKPLLGGIRHKLNLLLYPGGDLLDVVFANKFLRYGPTHTLTDGTGAPIVVHTVDPKNINSVLYKNEKAWGPAKSRARTMYPLAQEGLLNSEGDIWHKNRKMILRHIGTKRAKDVRNAEADIQLLYEAMGTVDHEGWTDTVDLLDLFHRLSLDISTTFLLGTSANSQASGMRDVRMRVAMKEVGLVPGNKASRMSYSEAYEIVRNFFSWRSKLGSKYWLADSLKYRQACERLNSFADDLIGQAIKRRATVPTGDDARESDDSDDKFGLIDSLVEDIGNPVHIRNLVMDLFIAGQNMTGTIAAWVFAQLAANQDILNRVREEVLEKFGTEYEPRMPLTWDNLQSCTTMQHVILETLRMYPLLANIGGSAREDTILPTGGGADGLQPIAVPKGTAVTCNVYLTHRREEEWGVDAWKFNPDRWHTKKFGPEYAPFGMGPRICIGQQLSKTELSFLIARMMQHFSEIQVPEGQDNLTKGYRVVVAPKNGVKVRLRVARDMTGSASPLLGARRTPSVSSCGSS